jgi:hypothetical protein
MGTTAGWRRNTYCKLAREEQEDDEYNRIEFRTKPVAKRKETGRSKKNCGQSAVILIYAIEAI